MESEKDLNYYKANAEEDYMTTPISVLRYITELEQALQLQQTGVSGLSEQLCGNLDENFNCKNMCLTRCIDGNKFYKQHNCH